LLPTPTAANYNDGESLTSWNARQRRNIDRGWPPYSPPLSIALRLLTEITTSTSSSSNHASDDGN
jgi:hypothetical protein